MKDVFIFLLLNISLFLSCHKNPSIALSADSWSENAQPPMNASTYNSELKVELTLLEDLLEQRISQKKIDEAKSEIRFMIDQKTTGQSLSNLSKLFLLLPELIHADFRNISNKESKLFKAKLLFYKRRFVESATLLSEIIDHDPLDYESKSLRARCLFFLGSPHMALDELIEISKTTKDNNLKLESWYLIGAIVYESSDFKKAYLELGLKYWQNYLREAKNNEPIVKEIEDGLAQLKARLFEKAEAKPKYDPFLAHDSYDAEKNAALKAFQKGELLLASELIKNYLQKNKDPDLLVLKARVMIKNGDFAKASSELEQIATDFPNYAPAFHYQGMTFMMMGKSDQAVLAWEKVLQLDVEYGSFHKLKNRIDVAKSMGKAQKVESH